MIPTVIITDTGQSRGDVYTYIIIVIIASEIKSSAKLLTPLSPAYKQTTRGHFEGERVRTPLPLLKSCGTHGNVVPVVKLFKNALWTALRTTVRPKCTILQDFAFKISKFFRGSYPGPRRSAPGAWAQTSISAWLASNAIVPVSRNDH